MCACMRPCMPVCVRACMCVYVRVCVRACALVWGLLRDWFVGFFRRVLASVGGWMQYEQEDGNVV